MKNTWIRTSYDQCFLCVLVVSYLQVGHALNFFSVIMAPTIIKWIPRYCSVSFFLSCYGKQKYKCIDLVPHYYETHVCTHSYTWIVLCMRLANGRRRYIATSSPIGWAYTQNHPVPDSKVCWRLQMQRLVLLDEILVMWSEIIDKNSMNASEHTVLVLLLTHHSDAVWVEMTLISPAVRSYNQPCVCQI